MSNAPLANRPPQGGPETGIQQYSHKEPWHDSEWQRLWLAVESRPWRSLALVPAGTGAPLDFTLVVAVTLSRTGMVHVGTPLQVADATSVSLSQLTAFINEVKAQSGKTIPTAEAALLIADAKQIQAVLAC